MLNGYLTNMSNLPNRSIYCLRCRKKTLSTNVQLHEQNRPKGGEGKQYKFGAGGCGGKTVEMWWWRRKSKQKDLLVVERASLPSSSLPCTISAPRISEPGP